MSSYEELSAAIRKRGRKQRFSLVGYGKRYNSEKRQKTPEDAREPGIFMKLRGAFSLSCCRREQSESEKSRKSTGNRKIWGSL